MEESVMADTIQLDQYRVPLSYELAGRTVSLAMDKRPDCFLHFLDEENLQISEPGKPFIWERYHAMKADGSTYFVHIQPALSHDLVNWVFILDTEQRLITWVTVQEGYDPEHPRLMQVIPWFGTIRVSGLPAPSIRHHLSRRMAGEHIRWHYMPGFTFQHIYHNDHCVRGSAFPGDFEEELKKRFSEELASDDPAVIAQAEAKMKYQREFRRMYPFYEEPAFHIWINDHLNLFSFIEENMCRHSPGFKEGGGGMIVLQDIERLIDVGLCFNPDNYRYSDTYLLTAYGEKNPDGDPIDTVPSPYDWSVLTGMPTLNWEIQED